MQEDKQVIGPWARVKVLGCGGFGQVTLWYKKDAEEYIAIKKPQETDVKDSIKNNQMKRWCKEVEMMRKLEHLNIVKALAVPPELQCLSKSPMLAMEYCGLGDLRQVLNKPENCCGLSESTIMKILKDVSSGLEYLHSCSVVHRDLKPENIVLQCRETVTIYKLIDLGYAKELDQSSLCKSFVGTVQYLAPELFLGKMYSRSVDYWSFGILAHEIITGYRPFLPGSNPPEWMKQVQNKPRNIISVIENPNGTIIYSSTISRVNHVSRCLLPDIEKWLALALDWDGEARGKVSDKLIFFDKLKEILDKKVVKVFSLPTYEILCYEIKEDTEVSTLKYWLESDTGINTEEQVLLLSSGKCLDSTGLVLNVLKQEVTSPGAIGIFLYNRGFIKIKSRVVLKPLYVKELLEDPKKEMNFRHLKRSCSDSVFVLKLELHLFECLLEALRVKVANVHHRERSVVSLFEDVSDEWRQVESFAQFLILSLKEDLENYLHLRKEGELQSSEYVQKWTHKVTDVENRLSDIASASNKKKLKLAVEEAKEKCKGLENNSFIKTHDTTVLKDLLKEGQIVWENVHRTPKENRNVLRSNTDAVKILWSCIVHTTKLLRSPMLALLFLQLSEAEEHLTKVVSPLTVWLESTKIMRQIIENTQFERQKEIWNMVVKQKRLTNTNTEVKPTQGSNTQVDEEEKKKKSENQNQFSPFHIPKTVENRPNTPEEEVLKPNFRIMEPVSVPHNSHIGVSDSGMNHVLMQSFESDNIISMNNYLRHRMEQMNQSWHNTIEEIKTFDWNSLNV